VTAHVGEISFYTPVKVGSMVELNAKVIHTGKTSMHIAVRVSSCDLRECQMTGAIRRVLIFVALDDNGKPTAIPPWIPETKDDIALETYAKHLVELRQKIYQELGDIKVKW